MHPQLVATGAALALCALPSVAFASQPPYELHDTPQAQPDPRPERPKNSAGPCAAGEDSRDVCIARDIFFMPGVTAVGFMPAANKSDPFLGGGVHMTPLRWSHNNDRFGPSQGAVFLQAAILQSAESSATLSLFDLGYSLSLERNSSRRFLIPFFGGTVGALSHETLGNSGYTYQFAGAHLYWHHNFVVTAEGGYQFPFERVDDVRGPRAQFSAGFSMW